METDAVLYEAMYILSPDVADDEMEEITEAFKQVLEAAGAEVVADELFGRRRLAYEINHYTEGIYRIVYFNGDGEAVSALKNEFGLNERVMRGMVVAANPDAIFHSREEEEQQAEQLTEQIVEPEASVPEPTAPQPEAAEEPVEPAAPEPVAQAAEEEPGGEATEPEPEAEAAEEEPETDKPEGDVP